MIIGSLLKVPYTWVWRWKRRRGTLLPPSVYIAEAMDWVIWREVKKHIQEELPVIAKKPARAYLERQGIPYVRTPAFPEAVVMFRHGTHRFPADEIIKVGMNHGAYRFKSFTKAAHYRAFHRYLFTSERENALARDRDIRNGRVVGSPKLDPLLNRTLTTEHMLALGRSLKLDGKKQTILFTATFARSGLSAVERWVTRVGELTDKYNVLVTVHPWNPGWVIRTLRDTPGIVFVEDPDLLPYLCLADALIGDTSSVIGDYCVLDRPIITFEVPSDGRLNPEIPDMLERIGWRVTDFDGLKKTLDRALGHPAKHHAGRTRAAGILLNAPDGGAGRRAAEEICRVIPGLHPTPVASAPTS